jgi:Tol biopolymer transport system component
MAGEVFISYRRTDVAWAKLLHEQLSAEGVQAWYDARIGAGQDWRMATAKALEASRIFVLLFTASAAESSDIAKELAAAVQEKKLVVPVRLENIAPKGAFLYELASRNWINAYEDTEAKLAELAKGLAQMVKSGAQDESVLPFERSDDTRLPPPQKRLSKPVLVAAAAVVFAATAIAAWLLWPAPHWTVESSRPFISTLALEDFPAFSADGKMLAYTSGPADGGARKIYVRNVGGGQGIRVTSDPYDDISPTWSSDGTRIAYVAIKPGEPCRIMVVTVPAGETREAGRCSKRQSSRVAWQPATPFVYYFDTKALADDTIFRLNLDTGERLKIVRQAAIGPMYDLHCSPDGKSLVYLWAEGGYGTQTAILRDLASGKERKLGMVTQTALGTWPDSTAWTADSRTVLMSSSNGVGSEIIAHPVDGGRPYRVYETATGIGRLAAGGGLLAVETDVGRVNLARTTSAPATQPDVIDQANGISVSPSYSPDGTLAFISNRSGTNAVWIAKPGAAPAMLFDAGAASLFRVNFSPDGSRLAIVLFSSSGIITVKVLTVNGAGVSAFDMPSIGPGLPSWSPDGKELVVFDFSILRGLRINADNPAHRRPAAPPAWINLAIREDGIYGAKMVRNGLWQIDKGPRLISAKFDTAQSSPDMFLGDDLLVPDFSDRSMPRILAQPLKGGPDRVLAYAPGAITSGFAGTMTVNPKTGEVIYAASVLRDTNIDLLTLAQH